MTRPGIFSLPRQLRPLAVRARLGKTKKIDTLASSYTCLALTGQSDYNICINADLSVSCNCADFDGSGKIGDLRHQSLNEVFTGEKVNSFLSTLFKGEIPIHACLSCPELKILEEGSLIPFGRVPTKGLMIENTAACNYRCGFCDRELLLKNRNRINISLSDLKKVTEDLSKYSPEVISYFNLGEPFLSNTILEEIKILKEALPKTLISTSTNGAKLEGAKKIEAALLMDGVVFSIDGVSQESLAKYQERGDFVRAYKNMSELVQKRNEFRNASGEKGPCIVWKYVLFKWNESSREISTAMNLAREAGVDALTFIPGTTNAENVSYRYYTDKNLEKHAVLTATGRSIQYSPVPAWLD